MLASLTCTCRSARKWQRLSAYLAGLIGGYLLKSHWALKLPCLSLLGCLVRYPKIATKMVDDLDFARRLQCLPTDAYAGLNQYVKKDIRLCLRNLKSVERKRRQLKADALRRTRSLLRSAEKVASCLARRGHF